MKQILRFYSKLITGENFDKKIYLKKDKLLSYWHDINYKTKDTHIIQVGIEIPKFTLSKMELNKKADLNPIMQDKRKNKFDGKEELRYYAQFAPFNYGFIPQTWENPFIKDKNGLIGDDDPFDVIELSGIPVQTGDLITVRVLGCFLLLDQGELDWKLITIQETEAKKLKINSVNDINEIYPALMKHIFNWFINIKTFDGKKQNQIYENKIYDKDFALEEIEKAYQQWQLLKNSQEELYLKKRKEFNIKM